MGGNPKPKEGNLNWIPGLTLLALAANLVLAGFVLVRQPRNIQSHLFAALAVSVFGWGLSLLLFQISPALLFAKFSFVFGSLIPASLLLFSLHFPRQTAGPKLTLLSTILLTLPPIAFAVSSLTPLLSTSVRLTGEGISGDTGPLFPLFNIYFLTYVLAAFGILIWKYWHARGIALAQIRYLFLGTLLFAVIAIATNLILPALEIFRFNTLGPSFSLIQLGFISYAIIAHRLFDIRVIIKKTVIYSGLLAFVIGTYSLIIFTLASVFGTSAGVSRQTFLPNLIAALVVAAGFEPLRKWLVATTDKYLFVGEYRPEEVLRDLSQTLSGVIDLDEALQGMMQTLVKAMRLKRAATFVLRRYKGEFEVKRVKQIGFAHPDKLTLAKDDPLIVHFQTRMKSHREKNERRQLALVTDELARRIEEDDKPPKLVSELAKRLSELGAAVALPIIVKNELIGILVLSEKLSGDIFTSSDLELLEIAAHETAGAIEKARFWEEDQLKSEFVSIASHELLTPTSTIQGYLSMILDEGMGQVDPKAREYLVRVRATSKRLTELVQDLLNVSRIESGRIKISPQPLDLLPVIRQVVEELTPQAHGKGLSLYFEDPARQSAKVAVFADPERVRQILVNLIGNGVKYTPKGGVTVAVEKQGRLIKTSVTDTGVGMSPADQQHLFEKFYRVQNEQTQGVTGTGLGLYITKSIIELMGGKIGVESVAGRGSTFSFTLPATESKHIEKK